MSISAHQTINDSGFPTARIGKGKVWVFLMVFLLSSFGVVGQSNTPPVYTWLREVNLPTVNVSFTGVNTDDITVSVATDPEGNVYTLSFGNGIAKRNADGTLINANFIPASKLDGPLDIAIDSEGFIYVANYLPEGDTFEDNGQIRVFNPQGNLVRTILTSFYRPMGLVVDENKVYVAEFYDGKQGPEPGSVYSRVRIYDKFSGTVLDSTDQVEVPLRIAIDSQKNVYVGQAGYNNNPKVLIFDPGLNSQTPLGNITTPGSIVIDAFDYIHVVEYAGRINFSEFINFENLGFGEAQAIAKKIYDGQRADAFSIKIFSPARILITTLKDHIDFPLDLAFNNCDRMYVNNAEVFGSSTIFGFIPSKIEFDLEIYKRTPSFDQEKPLISCPASIEKTAPPGQNYAIVEFANPTVTDNCSFTVAQTNGNTSGSQFPVGTHIIEFTATDAAGNFEKCSFTIKVNPAEEEPDTEAPEITCPQDITRNVDAGTCGAVVTYATPTATDNSGSATITLKSGIASGGTFPVGPSTVIYEAIDDAGNKKECSFTVTVTDNEKPFITCPSDITKEIPADQNSVVVEFNKPVPTDNCSGATVTQTQGLASGSQFTVGTHTIEFTATDATGNKNTCSFTIQVNPAEEEPDPVTIICLGNKNDYFGAGCRFEIPDYRNNATFTTGANVTQLPAQGTFVTANTKIILTATLNGESDSCEFELILEDKTLPVFNNCPGSRTVTADSNGNFTVPDYTHFTDVTDNCGTVNLVQFPVEGEIIDETTEIIFTATDANGNTAGCSFTLTLIQQTPPLQISCPGNQEATLGDNCSFMVPDYRNNGGVNPPDAQIVQQPAPGTIINESTSITLTATLGDETDSCSFELNLKDIQNPVFTCFPEQNITFDPDVGYTVPNYREEANPSDNCDFEWVQTPAPNTVIYASQTIEISATDAAGNRTWCSFIVRLTEGEPNELQITCPGNQSAPLDANCEFLVPDYISQANVNNDGAIVTQNPPPGSTINSSTGIQLTATSGNQSVSCDFQLILEDVTAPTVACPSDQLENYDPTEDFALPDYRDLAVTSDACGIAQILQSPSPGTLITQNTTVSLAVTDFSGNSLTCAFMVNLTEDEVIQINCPEDQVVQPSENCSFALPDYTGLAEVNFDGAQVTQAPAPGSQISGNTTVILTASLNGQTDSCAFDVFSDDNTAPVAQCILIGSYRLNENGTLTLNPEQINNGSSDNCGIEGMEINRTQFSTSDIGDHNITLTVKDAAGNLDSCETTISILPYAGNGNDFACKTSVVLELDETGNAVLNSQDLYTGDPQERSFTISKTNFKCSDVGVNYINFTYQGNIDSGTCEIKVEVQDNLAPIVQTQNVTINLNEDGLAEITPALINSGTTDNCGVVNFTLDKFSFGCKDLGENMVRLTAVDNNGNSATATAMVTVMGICKQEPPPGGNGPDEIFIYPNPSPGPFTIATPNGVKIFKVEIFDFRGRFLHSKDFAEDVPAYTMDIWGVEQAVYVLKIYTSDGIRIRRVIKF